MIKLTVCKLRNKEKCQDLIVAWQEHAPPAVSFNVDLFTCRKPMSAGFKRPRKLQIISRSQIN